MTSGDGQITQSAEARFRTTHWSVVLAAGRSDTPRARSALEQLCKSYWQTLYHYVRRCGYATEDAQDLTQSFFARLLERQAVSQADPQRGRFRSFLLASLKHFLADEWDKLQARKRGGGQVFALDYETEETGLQRAPVEDCTPEHAYEKRWAMALLEQVYQRLEEDYERQGKAKHFAALRTTLAGSRQGVPYAELGQQLGMTVAAVKVAVHRLRHRYRESLRETIAHTVSNSEEVEDELRYLRRVLSR